MRSDDIRVPDLDKAKLQQAGFSHYHEMCRLCHGAPEYPIEEFSKGLYPEPPSMTSGNIQKTRNESEIYWIVKHGIKMTGMPAFGPTHKDEEVWGLAALANEMHEISPEQYRQTMQAAGLEGEKGLGHTHEEPKRGKDSDHGHGEPSAHDKGEIENN